MFFLDPISGRTIASGEVPAGWQQRTAVITTRQSYGRPFTAIVELNRENSGKMLFYDTGECYHKIKYGPGERHRDGDFDERTLTPVKNFQTPEQYLDKLALRYSGGNPVGLYAKEELPGFRQEPEMVEELNRSKERLSELCAAGIRIEIQNIFADAALRTYRIVKDGKVATLVLGTEICATEYCLKIAEGGQIFGQVVTPVDGMRLGVGMTVAMIRSKNGNHFGGSVTGGAKAAYIDWEARKVYGFLHPGEPDDRKVTILKDWMKDFHPEESLFDEMRMSRTEISPEEAREQNNEFRTQEERTIQRRFGIMAAGFEE